MKEEYKEIYCFKNECMEKVICRDLEMPRPFFKIETTYILPTKEKLTEVAYIGDDEARAMMDEVLKYENKTN